MWCIVSISLSSSVRFIITEELEYLNFSACLTVLYFSIITQFVVVSQTYFTRYDEMRTWLKFRAWKFKKNTIFLCFLLPITLHITLFNSRRLLHSLHSITRHKTSNYLSRSTNVSRIRMCVSVIYSMHLKWKHFHLSDAPLFGNVQILFLDAEITSVNAWRSRPRITRKKICNRNWVEENYLCCLYKSI